MFNIVNINDHRKEELYILVLNNGEKVGIGKEIIKTTKPFTLTNIFDEVFSIHFEIDFKETKLNEVDFLIRDFKELKETLESIGVQVDIKNI